MEAHRAVVGYIKNVQSYAMGYIASTMRPALMRAQITRSTFYFSFAIIAQTYLP